MEINAEYLFKPQVSLVSNRFIALPPAVQRVNEFLALLSDERLYQKLGNAEKIERIEKNENGYLVYTDNYTMQVNVKYIPETRFCGPAKCELEFCEPVPQVTLPHNSRLNALPPGVQRTRELIAIFSDERLYEALGNGEMIDSIEKNENGYLICTERYTLQVNVKYLQENGFCGPAKFELEFCKPQPYRT